jgi:glycosyltransferase involved in cell wall biosynthesis
LVLPSSFGETWGLVVNEAMASGLPAIVSDRVGCAPDLIQRARTGEVFPCGDVRGLSMIMESFASHPERVQQMGQKAYERVQNYSVSHAVEGTRQAIRFVVGGGT